ncbi:MAG: hypothetical protein LUO93_09345, partial [Methanomicrobiales archaeon]|nr:hypothetical protein [Methanomicrobiales archaeon]
MPRVDPGLARILGTPEDVTLPGGEHLRVFPFTLREVSEMDALEPGEMTGREYMVLRLWMVLRNVEGYRITPEDGSGPTSPAAYAVWKLALTGPAYVALRSLADA